MPAPMVMRTALPWPRSRPPTGAPRQPSASPPHPRQNQIDFKNSEKRSSGHPHDPPADGQQHPLPRPEVIQEGYPGAPMTPQGLQIPRYDSQGPPRAPEGTSDRPGTPPRPPREPCEASPRDPI